MRFVLLVLSLMVACSVAALAAGYSSNDMPAGAGPAVTPSPAAGGVDLESDAFNRSFISQYYSIPESQLVELRDMGYSWDQISMMANAAALTNQPITQIAALRNQGMSWGQIADRYNVAYADLTRPVRMRTVTAMRPALGAGPMAPMYIYDRAGNVLLTADEANRYCKMGYDWMDIAVATNISRDTGVPVNMILQEMRTGALTWDTITQRYSVSLDSALNIEGYPFDRCSSLSPGVQERRMKQIQRYQRAPGGYYTTRYQGTSSVMQTGSPGALTTPSSSGTGY